VPGNVSYNGYMGMRELLRVIQETGSTNNLKIIKALEGRKMAAADRMQHYDAVIDPVSHHVQQTIYLAGRNDKPADKTDYFKIISMATPEEARDPNEQRDCKLQAYNDTPSYEQ
jgi:branched-chain amino acid transport system substrate-binding protein